MVRLAHSRHHSGGSLETRVIVGRGDDGSLRLVTRENNPGESQSGPEFQQGRKPEREASTPSCCPQTQMTFPSPPHSLLSSPPLASFSFNNSPAFQMTQPSERLSLNNWEEGSQGEGKRLHQSWQRQHLRGLPTPCSPFLASLSAHRAVSFALCGLLSPVTSLSA